MMVHDGSNSMLVTNFLNVWKLIETTLIPGSPWLEEIVRKEVTGLGFAKLVTGAVVVVEDRATKVTEQLGRQDSIFLATETIITTCMQLIADIMHEFGLALTEE